MIPLDTPVGADIIAILSWNSQEGPVIIKGQVYTLLEWVEGPFTNTDYNGPGVLVDPTHRHSTNHNVIYWKPDYFRLPYYGAELTGLLAKMEKLQKEAPTIFNAIAKHHEL